MGLVMGKMACQCNTFAIVTLLVMANFACVLGFRCYVGHNGKIPRILWMYSAYLFPLRVRKLGICVITVRKMVENPVFWAENHYLEAYAECSTIL